MIARDRDPSVRLMILPKSDGPAISLLVQLPRRKSVPLNRMQAVALITLLEAYGDAADAGFDHGGVGIQGVLFDITPDTARMFAALITTALPYLEENP